MNTSDSPTNFDSPHSPLRSSPLSDNGDPFHSPENSPQNDLRDNSRAIVIVETTSTQFAQAAPPASESEHRNPPPETFITRPVRPETRSPGVVGRTRPRAVAPPMPVVPKREVMAKKVAFCFRLSEVVLCLISFSVMAADKTRGWSGDSFDRYKEYRFKVLAYLLISAASSAATRVDDWQSNWGKDEFTEMASASIALAFLAFVAFAISSLFSGYNLCTLFS
ncbi:CASP-like protein 4A3 [Glycine soja]